MFFAMPAAADSAAVGPMVDALRQAMLSADKAKLTELLSDQMVYVHSAGKVESKTDFLDVVAGKKTVYKSINIADQTITTAGTNAIVRHVFSGEAETDGKVNAFKVGVMQVWQQAGGKWQLVARQAYKL